MQKEPQNLASFTLRLATPALAEAWVFALKRAIAPAAAHASVAQQQAAATAAAAAAAAGGRRSRNSPRTAHSAPPQHTLRSSHERR